MAIHHNEYIGWELEFPAKLQDQLVAAYQKDEDTFETLRDSMHEKYPIIDTFHTDCVTFQWSFDSKEEAKRVCDEITKDTRAWLKKQEVK